MDLFFFRGAVYLHGVSVKIVQGERNAKSQRENIEGKFIFTLLSEAEIQYLLNLFEHLTSAPSLFISGRRPKGSEPQPIFKLRAD